jgi:hypothetical protein
MHANDALQPGPLEPLPQQRRRQLGRVAPAPAVAPEVIADLDPLLPADRRPQQLRATDQLPGGLLDDGPQSEPVR